jgi:hypothetical protein
MGWISASSSPDIADIKPGDHYSGAGVDTGHRFTSCSRSFPGGSCHRVLVRLLASSLPDIAGCVLEAHVGGRSPAQAAAPEDEQQHPPPWWRYGGSYVRLDLTSLKEELSYGYLLKRR